MVKVCCSSCDFCSSTSFSDLRLERDQLQAMPRICPACEGPTQIFVMKIREVLSETRATMDWVPVEITPRTIDLLLEDLVGLDP